MPTARRSAISTLRKSRAARPPSCSPYQPAREAALLVTAVRSTAMATVARLTLTSTGTQVPGPALTAGPVTDSPLNLCRTPRLRVGSWCAAFLALKGGLASLKQRWLILIFPPLHRLCVLS